MQTAKDNLGTSDLQKQLEKVNSIAEILSKLEEVHLGKDWLIQEIKNRVLRMDPETGYRIHTTPTPQIKFLDDMTVMRWSKSNLKAHDAYEFYW